MMHIGTSTLMLASSSVSKITSFSRSWYCLDKPVSASDFCGFLAVATMWLSVVSKSCLTYSRPRPRLQPVMTTTEFALNVTIIILYI